MNARGIFYPVRPLRRLLALVVCSLLGFAGIPFSSRGTESLPVPLFELPEWKSSTTIRLADYAGSIVVLDFFAYWCVPCKQATAELERTVQQHYAQQRGNPQGIPVQVISVNIEDAMPALTDRFIRETGAHRVAHDAGGELLDQLNGAATPFVVILDGSQATREKPEFQLVYKNEGFEGTRKLRSIIDRIPRPANPGEPAVNDRDLISNLGTAAPVEAHAEMAFDAILASDVKITATSAGYRHKKAATEWRIGYFHNSYDVDYRPFRQFDFLGFPDSIEEELNGLQAGWKQGLTRAVTLSVAGAAYDGFTDYRSIWLANYYRQQFGFVPGYERPEPRGFSASGSLRWEYQPTTGFIEASFRYANDRIAPGLELDQGTTELLRGREYLHTYAPALKFENVLTRRIRLQNEFELRITSGRDPRYLYRGTVSTALGESWVWRTSGGYTHEDPTLRAWFVGSTVELEFLRGWYVNVSGLYYADTGEIENSLFISTAAPGLRTVQVGPGIRHVSRRASFSLSASPLWTDYDGVEVGTRPFTNLYRDRDWVYVQAALDIQF